MSASMEARIAEHAAAPTPPLPVSSLPLPLPSPLTTSPTNVGAPLGYRAVGIRMRALLPSTSYRTDILEAEIPPRKRACFTTPAPRLEVGESSAAGAARQPGPTLEADLRQETEEFQECSFRGYVRTLKAQVVTLMARTTSLQTQLTTALGRIQTLEARDPEPQDEPTEKMPPKKRTIRTSPATTTTTSTPMTDAQIQALIEQGVAAALAEHDADRSRNGDDSHDSGTGGGR
ncbi:hypothetical protein Tco_1494350 [Tanacetum coccineum]